jgi:hypothetical protein
VACRMPPSSSIHDAAGDDCSALADDGALRCACGSLLARYVAGGIELKCKRCKRTVIVAVEGQPPGPRRMT